MNRVFLILELCLPISTVFYEKCKNPGFLSYKVNIIFLTEKLPYSQIFGPKVGPAYKKRRHSEGLRKEQKGTVSFIGDQANAVIPIQLDMVKVQEFEVYIREVTGASYVSITLPKSKVKVVDDCPTYSFIDKSASFLQGEF